MAETIVVWDHEPCRGPCGKLCIASQKEDQDAGRCRSICNARKGSPIVQVSNDDCLEVKRVLKIYDEP